MEVQVSTGVSYAVPLIRCAASSTSWKLIQYDDDIIVPVLCAQSSFRLGVPFLLHPMRLRIPLPHRAHKTPPLLLAGAVTDTPKESIF